MTVAFLLAALVVVLIPGTGVIYTLSQGVFRGRRAALIAAVGCTLGIVPHLLATLMGLAVVMHASALLFQTMKWLGIAYLLYMAWGLWRAGGQIAMTQPKSHSARRIIVDGVLLNLLNPKLTIFFLAFLPQFTPASHPHPLWHMTGLALTFMALTWAVFSVYGLLAASLRARVLSSPRLVRRIQRSFALAFAGFGLKLALTEQR
ncbi:LysE family translocator [Magnetofaba australis]|uniref:Putative lysine exporter protein LysE/YggA n=1 Tax=Magnetofaba australis IT-1 TaxID=1434232 RepID=A0A1Y2K6B0_9PROT|nr:LysE family translocator [Magnetofaba australis]OSM03961.1 putative lysine exporter protein LysE/YggA [Magnetofaba australis IT-1]